MQDFKSFKFKEAKSESAKAIGRFCVQEIVTKHSHNEARKKLNVAGIISREVFFGHNELLNYLQKYEKVIFFSKPYLG